MKINQLYPKYRPNWWFRKKNVWRDEDSNHEHLYNQTRIDPSENPLQRNQNLPLEKFQSKQIDET